MLVFPKTSLGWATVLAFSTFTAYCFLARRKSSLPPGPRGTLIIGNVIQLSVDHVEALFQLWAKKYGNIMYIQVLNQPMLILSDLKTVRDLLDTRGSIYSDRPRFVLFSELMGWHDASTHVRYGPRFRKHRRFIQQSFNQRAVANFYPLQRQETLTLLDNLIRVPELFVQHFRKFAAATMFKITYGHDITSADDFFITLAERAGTLTIASGTPAATLVDYFPILRYIPTWAPFSGFKRNALEARKAVDDMFNIPFDMVKANVRSGNAVPSFTSTLLQAHGSLDGPVKDVLSEEDEGIIKGAAGTLFAAAEDTTVSVMETFMLAMVRNPDVYKKAQDEIDKVIGRDRLPNLEDRNSLPYLDCILKEVLRWNPPAPLGMPHRLMEDDVYKGYHIPAGINVYANIYAILRDCDRPDSFIPERYLADPGIHDPKEVVFGFGRRICPGRHFAETSAWCMMANIIATLDITLCAEDRERGMVPPLLVRPGFIRHPKSFSCSICPRSEKVVKLIQEALA